MPIENGTFQYDYFTNDQPNNKMPDVVEPKTWPGGKDSLRHKPLKPKMPILNSALDCIGWTPVVRLQNFAKHYGLECELLAKCEFFNPGGSIKDRIGLRMIEEAERDGVLKPGSTIIEATSGNTGIGLAMAAAVKGYRCIITLPEKMSKEKVDVLRGLGAEIVRTPTSAAFDSPESHISKSHELCKQIPNSVILDQYRNPYNPVAHYDATGEEILQQLDEKVDLVVMGAGTGGTITGVAAKIKERVPNCKIIAVDPHGSILANHVKISDPETDGYEVEGIGYDFIPTVLKRNAVDEWARCNDLESFTTARELIQREGLLCGGSSGSAMSVALKEAKKLKKGQRCLVILPDGVRNYMTKFLSDEWMTFKGFMSPPKEQKPWWFEHKVTEMPRHLPLTIQDSATCGDLLDLISKERCHVIVTQKDGFLTGATYCKDVLKRLRKANFDVKAPVSTVMKLSLQKVSTKMTLGRVSALLENDPYAMIVERIPLADRDRNGFATYADKCLGIVSSIDLIKYINSKKDNH